ncbi:MAG: hypothetical protein DRI75_07845 [Bacteroidetes bacterium]|nr:MAG: hypothetical protein DRI75_07845 [Bacteroidota bacterium]
MNCKNCDANLNQNSNYCNDCGAKVIRNRLTPKNLFADLSEQFLNYDNKFLQTLINLFSKPEDVIGCYINGTRKKYVNVISYFAIAITISGLQLFILNKYFPELVNLSSVTIEGQEEFANKNLEFLQEYQSIVMMISVPIYALISKIVFFNIKTYNYTEHLVLFMYIFSQITIIGALFQLFSAFFGISIGTTGVILLPFQILYSSYCLKHLFKLSLKGIILRTLLFLLVCIVLYIVALILIIGIIFLTQGQDFFKEIIEAQNAAKEASGG